MGSAGGETETCDDDEGDGERLGAEEGCGVFLGVGSLHGDLDFLRMDLEDRSKQTLEALNKLEEAHQRTEAEKGEITDRYNKLVETERKLHLPDLRNALSSATAKVAKYEKSLEQSQKIIAQVTADNLVFLTKFKDAEEKFRESEMRREELQVMVDEQKGPWFDKVRGDIQQQVESDWQKIHNLENELSAAELESKKEINRLQEKVEGLSSENEELQKVKGSMEERIKSLKEKLRQREEKDIKAATDFESLNQLLKDNLAENKVLRETINDERHTIADLTLESQDQKHVIEQLKSDLKFDRVTLQELRVNLQKEKWALETQRRINKELMSRKEEMEWRLMEFQVGGGEGKSAEDSNADLAAMREEAGTGGRQESHSRPSANSAEKQPEAVAPRKDDAVKSDFSYKVVEKEKKVEEQVVERKSPGFREEVCEPSGKDDTQEGSVPAGLTESNLKRHIQGEKASKASKASSEASGKAAKGERLTIEELEDNIATSKDKHAELLQAFFPAQSEKRIEENPLQVHQRLVQKIIGDDTYVPVSHSVPSGEISSADATIASMLRESITENSSIGELEASIALAKSEYSKMMDNFSNLVDNLKNESASPGLETMPVLPESIQKMAEEQFVEHWQIADGNHSETKESIQASEIKVSEWLDNKISEEWNKQFMPGYQEGDES
ncbi:hypothetical protein A3770_02p11470 [Chloropicon primus]|uniref:Uncharacterized protein n=1 Tax=Chloropicon primus TaxID=1764295 RepID=A0A5B8MDX0_9CHLO|nr:hypothetical protein A3770_02p11470 [Chloropicon primus]|eukprot:QDZ18629.1 hypothetical protein A3770_02p11470 [Chloropicon primus]